MKVKQSRWGEDLNMTSAVVGLEQLLRKADIQPETWVS